LWSAELSQKKVYRTDSGFFYDALRVNERIIDEREGILKEEVAA
jgi:hypothetical protein